MNAPAYARLGNNDLTEPQEAIELNIIDQNGKHVDLGTAATPATTSAYGTVKQAAKTTAATKSITATSTLGSAAAAAETPTKDEFDKAIADIAMLKTSIDAANTAINELKTQLNALIASMTTAGQMSA